MKVTIVPRGRSLGAAWYLPEERSITTTEQITDEICTALGGRAAEELIFGKISTGALSDLEKVTKQAYAMVTIYGLNKKVGNISYYDSQGRDSFTKPYSEDTAKTIDEEVSIIIETQYQRALQILRDNQDKLTLLADKLLEFEVIFKEDLEEIFGKRQWEKEEEVESIKVKLTNKMRQPAQPIDQIKDRPCVKACLRGKKSPNMPPADYWMKKDTLTCSRAGNCYNNFDIKMGVYVVNCAMHKQRYDKFKKFAEAANLKACRVPCVLGTKFTQELMCKMIKDKLVSPKADMTTIEVSINMSHFNCWKKLVISCQEYALILEDDIEVKPDFIEKINLIMERLKDTDNDDF